MIRNKQNVAQPAVESFRSPGERPSARTNAARLLVFVLGVVAGQAILYGPSLIGARILLPLDVLAEPKVYLPLSAAPGKSAMQDVMLSDLVLCYEPERQFAISELRAGRLPLWSPYEFGGRGCYRWNLSPTWLLGYLFASPAVLAWIQLLIALVAASGAYVFFRRVLEVEFWPAAIAAWCYPLTGAYIVWQGFWLPSVMRWLPWMLVAVEMTVRRPWGWGGPLLALLSGIVLLSGAPDIGGQVLLASGIYAAWRIVERYAGSRLRWQLLHAAAAAALAWTVGILLSAWMLLPLADYMRAGSRPAARSEGVEERPPAGLSALPQVVLPDMYGSNRRGSYRIGRLILPESTAGGYAGLLATLFFAPLAWTSRRHRSICGLALLLGVVGLAWSIDLPGLVQVLRMPGLNLMSHNRFVFVTALAILILAAVGLNELWQGTIARRAWFFAPLALLAGLAIWCIGSTVILPEQIATGIGAAVSQGKPPTGISDMADVYAIQNTFRQSYVVGAVLAAIGAAAWCCLWIWANVPRWGIAALAAALFGELIYFGYGRSPQCDPALYYPRVPILQQLAAAQPGRVIGMDCLPANLAGTHGLRDVRGYDGVDPLEWIELLKPAAARDSKVLPLPYAQTQWMGPRGWSLPSGGVKLSPILTMLNVRYVLYRGSPAPSYHPAFQDVDYFAWQNPEAMPRAFVPDHVETVENHDERLARLADNNFNPRQVAYVEQPLQIPAACRGAVSITEDTPRRVTVTADMQTPGLIVLADRWDDAWKAYLDGQPAPILRTNHAVRGVAVPAGRQVLEFRFEPAWLARGAVISGVALAAWLAWLIVVAIRRRTSRGDSTYLPEELTESAIIRVASTRQHARSRRRRDAD